MELAMSLEVLSAIWTRSIDHESNSGQRVLKECIRFAFCGGEVLVNRPDCCTQQSPYVGMFPSRLEQQLPYDEVAAMLCSVACGYRGGYNAAPTQQGLRLSGAHLGV